MRSYDRVRGWVAGAVGRPGERTFYLQFTAGDGTHGYLLEKAQVAALVLEGRRLLDAIGGVASGGRSAGAPDEMVVPEFRISEIHLAYEDLNTEVRITLLPTGDDIDSVAFSVTPQQFADALPGAQAAVEGGRPACPRCGLAMDPDGHNCPSTNGDLRGHRP